MNIMTFFNNFKNENYVLTIILRKFKIFKFLNYISKKQETPINFQTFLLYGDGLTIQSEKNNRSIGAAVAGTQKIVSNSNLRMLYIGAHKML